jgi:hypothetical protein
MARDTGDIAKVFGYARRTRTPVVLRGGGTSLNGQGQTDGILVDVRRHWQGIEVLDNGDRARVRPGTVLGHANRVLAEYGSRLGPDPASTDIATVGGVIANNSGGMRCGVTEDSYSTVRSLSFVLPSGTIVDTAEPRAEDDFARQEPELARGLEQIRDAIRADEELSARIRRDERVGDRLRADERVWNDAPEKIVLAVDAERVRVLDADDRAGRHDIAVNGAAVFAVVLAAERIALECRQPAGEVRARCVVVRGALARLPAVHDYFARGMSGLCDGGQPWLGDD